MSGVTVPQTPSALAARGISPLPIRRAAGSPPGPRLRTVEDAGAAAPRGAPSAGLSAQGEPVMTVTARTTSPTRVSRPARLRVLALAGAAVVSWARR
ncbi:hypothetical protein STENM223S_04370 [Streptomyces tendae]